MKECVWLGAVRCIGFNAAFPSQISTHPGANACNEWEKHALKFHQILKMILQTVASASALVFRNQISVRIRKVPIDF